TRGQAALLHALVDEELQHGLRARLREAAVEVGRTGAVGVTVDGHDLDPGLVLEHRGHLAQQGVRAALDAGVTGAEVDPVEDLQLGAGHHDLLLLLGGAALVVGGAGHLRAVVAVVGDAVLVIVLRRAAAELGQAGLTAAAVVHVLDAAAILVAALAALLLRRAGLIRAHVLGVGHPVTVAIGDGAAILGVGGHGGAGVLGVGHAVLIVVGIGAAVLVLEAVEVLGLIGALIIRAADAISVRIGRGLRRAEGDAHEDAEGRG